MASATGEEYPEDKAQPKKADAGSKGGSKAKGMAKSVLAYLKAHPAETKAILAGGAMGAMAGGGKGAALGLAAGAILGRQPQANNGLNELLAQGPTGPQGMSGAPYEHPEAQGMDRGPTGPQGGSGGGYQAPEAQGMMSPPSPSAGPAPMKKKPMAAGPSGPGQMPMSQEEARHRFNQQTGQLQGMPDSSPSIFEEAQNQQQMQNTLFPQGSFQDYVGKLATKNISQPSSAPESAPNPVSSSAPPSEPPPTPSSVKRGGWSVPTGGASPADTSPQQPAPSPAMSRPSIPVREGREASIDSSSGPGNMSVPPPRQTIEEVTGKAAAKNIAARTDTLKTSVGASSEALKKLLSPDMNTMSPDEVAAAYNEVMKTGSEKEKALLQLRGIPDKIKTMQEFEADPFFNR